jgi:hypothetical protein
MQHGRSASRLRVSFVHCAAAVQVLTRREQHACAASRVRWAGGSCAWPWHVQSAGLDAAAQRARRQMCSSPIIFDQNVKKLTR